MKRNELPPKKPAQHPTSNRPGSPEKLAVLIQRYENREEIFHNDDAEPKAKRTTDSVFAGLDEWERQIWWDYYRGRVEEREAEKHAATIEQTVSNQDAKTPQGATAENC
jgi:hypothetical protein